MNPLLPSSPSFAGHQTFALRSGWLKKGLDALQNPATGGDKLFNREEALVHLGVGKNMVQSIRYWLAATRMTEERDAKGREWQPSVLGSGLLGSPQQDGWDPFLEDETTLWLLHWQLAGPGSQSFSWVWAFNHYRDYEFTKEALVDSVYGGAQARVQRMPSRETVERDVECLIHTYVGSSATSEDSLDCPLTQLGLLRPAFE